ncbi:MAG: hypothetical protein ACOX5I_08855 [Gleimia sp.]
MNPIARERAKLTAHDCLGETARITARASPSHHRANLTLASLREPHSVHTNDLDNE